MCQPCLACANGVVDGRDNSIVFFCRSPPRGSLASIPPTRDRCRTPGQEGWPRPNSWGQFSKGAVSLW